MQMVFSTQNSDVRFERDTIIITHSGEAELPIDGDLKLMPFSHFYMDFSFEL
jgi:hypothetical protein